MAGATPESASPWQLLHDGTSWAGSPRWTSMRARAKAAVESVSGSGGA
jgi:hypothetical protein